MSALATKPCAACPYLRSAPKGFWSQEEFLNVVEQDHPLGHRFGCHLNASREHQDTCVGWLADQKRRGTPNLILRVRLSRDGREKDRFEQVETKGCGLYGSVAAMVRANLGRAFPARSPKAQALARKLGKAP